MLLGERRSQPGYATLTLIFLLTIVVSKHGLCRWQGYHLQAQMQSPMLTNKSIENEGLSENMGFNRKRFDDSGQ